MALTDPLIGRMLGDYRVIDILGRGGMARVYRGYDPKLDRYAAIKVIDAHLLSNQESEDEYRSRFRREARAIARLNHPNIVGIYQYGEVDALYYMAMVFIEGRDLGHILKDHIARGTRMPVSQMLRVVSDTAAALDYAHQGGVIHRDVKPSNIMVTNDGRAVLTDFGLALSVPEGSIGNTFGSAHYIAPEQAVSSAQAVPQSDLYSLAIVLYQMLTGKVPFDDVSAMSVALKHISDPPPPLRKFTPDLPPAVEQVVLKALEKDIKKRYPDGQSLVRALQIAFAPVLALQSDSSSRLPIDSPGQASLRRLSTEEIERVNLSSSEPLERPTWTERIPLQNVPGSGTGAARTPTLGTQSSLRAAVEAAKTNKPAKQDGSRALRTMGLILALIALVLAVVFLTSLQPQNPDNGQQVAQLTSAAETSAAAVVVETDTPPPTWTETTTPDHTGTAAALLVAATDQLIETTDEATSTRAPSNTRPPTRTPTSIGQPAIDTVTAVASTPTATDDVSAPLILQYDSQNLVLFNRSEDSVDIGGLRFVRVNQLGSEIGFNAREWRPVSGNSYVLPPGGCYQLWLISLSDQDTPSYCRSRFGWIAVGTLRQFWLSSEPGMTFDVRRGNRVLATCPTNAGECVISVD